MWFMYFAFLFFDAAADFMQPMLPHRSVHAEISMCYNLRFLGEPAQPAAGDGSSLLLHILFRFFVKYALPFVAYKTPPTRHIA